MKTRGYNYYDEEPYRLPAYFYLSYGPQSGRYEASKSDSIIKELPTIFDYIQAPSPKDYSLKRMASDFASGAREARLFEQNTGSIDDVFSQKVGRSQDQIEMILQGIGAVEQVRYDNLKSLYDDLLKVSNMHMERLHDYNTRDKTWLDIEKQYLGLKAEIRKENNQFNKSVSLLSKELREALIDWKKQKQKGEMLGESMTNQDNEARYYH